MKTPKNPAQKSKTVLGNAPKLLVVLGICLFAMPLLNTADSMEYYTFYICGFIASICGIFLFIDFVQYLIENLK